MKHRLLDPQDEPGTGFYRAECVCGWISRPYVTNDEAFVAYAIHVEPSDR